MNPILKVLLVTLLICFSLYLGIAKFLGSTTKLHDSLDLNSLGYAAPGRSSDKRKTEHEPEYLPKPGDKPADAPDRGKETRIDVNTVFARSRQADHEVVRSDVAKAAGDSTNAVLSTETRLKQTLGISEPPAPVRAVDVAFEIPPECDARGIVMAPLSVKYRHESPTIKGISLSELEFLVAEYRKCDGGIFHFSLNPLGKEDSTPALRQRRFDELKYFFLQHRVPKTALRFPDNS